MANALDKPVFVHIPKTGGSSIEEVLSLRNIHVGKSAFSPAGNDTGKDRRIYKLEAGVHCSQWHIAPSEHVPNSITVVRDPWDRLLTEFCYTRGIFHQTELTCEALSNWILDVLPSGETDAKAKRFKLITVWAVKQGNPQIIVSSVSH
jgi:hypothetical protein